MTRVPTPPSNHKHCRFLRRVDDQLHLPGVPIVVPVRSEEALEPLGMLQQGSGHCRVPEDQQRSRLLTQGFTRSMMLEIDRAGKHEAKSAFGTTETKQSDPQPQPVIRAKRRCSPIDQALSSSPNGERNPFGRAVDPDV